jgi:hypothetical protein
MLVSLRSHESSTKYLRGRVDLLWQLQIFLSHITLYPTHSYFILEPQLLLRKFT